MNLFLNTKKQDRNLFKNTFTWHLLVVDVFFYFFKKEGGKNMDLKTKDLIVTTQSPTDVLGHLFWFSVGKQMNKVNDLKNKLISSGLGEEWMPNRIRAVDAFRRATREMQTKRPTSNPKIFENILVREVYSDNEYIQRNIVVETVDQSNKKLGYETQTGIVRLDRKNSVILFETNDSDIRSLCKKAEEKFNLYRNHYSSQHIRVMITRILKSLAPTPMRENGIIYFIPNSMTKQLTKLVTFMRLLDNTDAYQVPVINSNDNRYMVNKKLTDHLNNLLNQCRSAEGLRKDQVKLLVQETNDAIRDYKEYKELTSSESEKFEEKILTLRSEVMKILKE